MELVEHVFTREFDGKEFFKNTIIIYTSIHIVVL